jgi:hypothetical protein
VQTLPVAALGTMWSGSQDSLAQPEWTEQNLVWRYHDYMTAKGITVRRKKYLPTGEVRPIFRTSGSRIGALRSRPRTQMTRTRCARPLARHTTTAASTDLRSTSPFCCLVCRMRNAWGC